MSLTARDLERLVFVADPRVSPRGDRAAITVTEILEADGDDAPRYRTRIHAVDLAARATTVLTAGKGHDTHPRFSPTGDRLAFLRSRDDAPADLHIISMDGGEAFALTERDAGIGTFAWHPDGSRLALCSPSRKEKPHDGGAPLRVTRTRHKLEGKGLLTEVPTEVLVVAADRGFGRGHEGRSLEPDVVAEFAFGVAQLSYSDDGETLYALAATTDAEHAEMRANIVAIDLATGDRRALLRRGMQIGSFTVDADSGDVWLRAPADQPAASAPAGLWRLPADADEPMLTSGDLDVAPSVGGDSRYGALPADPIPTPDGWICSINEHGRSNLAELAPDGSLTWLTDGDRVVTAFDGNDDVLVFVSERADRPAELFARYADGAEVRLTNFNDRLCDELGFIDPGAPHVVASDGVELAYWRLEPSQARDDAAIVVQVHGGPAANYGYGFTFEFQLLAAAGYTVVYGNPRGGSSFGRAFAGAIQGRYGTVDADDVMTMVEDAVARHPAPDPPVHLTGGSYGGFMTNWLVGRTHRFRSAVTQRSIANFVSFYGTSDIGPWFTEREIGAQPWDDLAKMWDQSPLKHVAQIETPLLILHSEQDHRCPIEQAEQLYSALRRLDRVPCELVRFPDEGHELSRSGRPDRRIARLEAILDWFARHA